MEVAGGFLDSRFPGVAFVEADVDFLFPEYIGTSSSRSHFILVPFINLHRSPSRFQRRVCLYPRCPIVGG